LGGLVQFDAVFGAHLGLLLGVGLGVFLPQRDGIAGFLAEVLRRVFGRRRDAIAGQGLRGFARGRGVLLLQLVMSVLLRLQVHLELVDAGLVVVAVFLGR